MKEIEPKQPYTEQQVSILMENLIISLCVVRDLGESDLKTWHSHRIDYLLSELSPYLDDDTPVFDDNPTSDD